MNDVHGENIPSVNAVRPSRARRRLFVAAFPPRDVLDVLAAVPRPVERGVHWIPRARWHATFRFLGDADPHDVVGRLASADLPTATAVLGPAVTLLGPDVVVAPVAGLERLAVAVTEATVDLGQPPGPRPFTGHVTLARLRRGAACNAVGVSVAAGFDVTEVCLVDSRRGEEGGGGGLRYDVVRRFATRIA